MLPDKIKELETAKAKLAQLEASIESELAKELASLPAKYGFADVNAFAAAVKAASGKRRGRKPGSAKSADTKATAAKPASPKKRKRAKITDETRASVKKLVGEGKTGTEIAKALGISLPSVHNVKTALGLIQKRGKK